MNDDNQNSNQAGGGDDNYPIPPTPPTPPTPPAPPIPPADDNQQAYPVYPPQPPTQPFPPSQGGYQDPYANSGLPPTPPAPPEEDKTPANFKLGEKLPATLNITIPENDLDFEQDYFLRLLAGSISLSKDEKKRIIESIPKLKQSQIDELIRIFEEEKVKFASLSEKHVAQLEKLAVQQYNEWMDIEGEFQQQARRKEEEIKADEIRKKLGL